jgi:hypothetical protein
MDIEDIIKIYLIVKENGAIFKKRLQNMYITWLLADKVQNLTKSFY